MSLVDPDTGEVVAQSTPDEARQRADRIRTGVEVMWQLVTEAYQRRDWVALGYGSWDDYTAQEFGTTRIRLPKEERREVVGSLREAGLSDRAIESATGVSRRTLIRDKQVVPMSPPAEDEDDEEEEPAPVTGIDGKTYQPSKPKPEITEEEQRELDRQGAIRRDQDRLHQLVNGWVTLRSLATNPNRAEILRGLIKEDRDEVLAIEAIYKRGKR